MSTKKTFKLDGKVIAFHDGDTIMDAALNAGEYIPHLCHNPEFTPHGSCRVCVIEVNGRHMSACTLPAAENIEVDNSSDEIMNLRRSLLQMLFVEGNHVCPGCEKSGACQLQAVAYYTGMLSPHYTHFFPRRSVDASHPDIMIDFNRCILCELCVKASSDVDNKNVFSISGRGLNSHLVINSASGKLGDSKLSASDKAVSVCPVGAILPKHVGYDQPLGQRLYDTKPISVVGDVASASPGNKNTNRNWQDKN
jgi:[NiFe] hydrogenase diaphorase moiety small subunit